MYPVVVKGWDSHLSGDDIAGGNYQVLRRQEDIGSDCGSVVIPISGDCNISTTTATRNTNSIKEIKIYSNKNYLDIVSDSLQSQNSRFFVNIIDVNGIILMSKYITFDKLNRISIQNLHTGLYIVTVSNDDYKTILSEKFIK